MERLSDILVGTLRDVELTAGRQRWPIGLATGLVDLDVLTGGLQRSDLIVLGSRPGVGKTALALTIAEHVAVHQGVGVAFVSGEMAKEQLAMRALCSEARVDLDHVRSGRLADRDLPRLAMAVGLLAEAPLYLIDEPAISVVELRQQLSRLGRAVGLIVVDRIDLLAAAGGRSDPPRLAATGRALKTLARDIGVPILATTPVDARAERRNPPIPRLRDLPGDGELEDMADVVMLLYREELYAPDTSRRRRADLIVAKQRNGSEGWVPLVFLGEYSRFETSEPEVSAA